MSDPVLSPHFWSPGRASVAEVMADLEATARTPMWSLIRHNLRDLPGPVRSIELGCGMGKLSMLLGLIGHDTTFFDSNQKSLEAIHGFMGALGLPHNVVCGDLLNLDPGLQRRFDLALSDGTIEHFEGDARRQQTIDAYYSVLKPGGFVLVAVPNALGLCYRPVFGIRRAMGLWPEAIPEIPYSVRELKARARRAGFDDVQVTGVSTLPEDFRDWIWPSLQSLSRRVTGYPLKKTKFAAHSDLEKIRALAAEMPVKRDRFFLNSLSAGLLLKARRPN